MGSKNDQRPSWPWSASLDEEITAVSSAVDRSGDAPLRHTDSWPMAPSVRWSGELEEVPSVDAIDPDPTPEALVLPDSSARLSASLTLLRGEEAGQTFRLSDEITVIGRDRRLANLVVKDSAVSRQHARILRQPGGQHSIEDLGSTNGTFLRGQPIQRALLAPGDRIQIGPLALFRFAIAPEDEEALQRELFESSTRDPLTGLTNRGTLLQRLEACLERARLLNRPVALLLIDLDHFKQINDSLGHPVGDRVLRVVAQRLARVVRTSDAVGRYGGEEFAVVARSTDRGQAHALAERIRSAIADTELAENGQQVRVTACIGVAESSEVGLHDSVRLVAAADERLYRAKRAGRNRVFSS